MDVLTILILTASLCLFALTGFVMWVGYRWVESRLPRAEEEAAPFGRRRPDREAEDEDPEKAVTDFVSEVDGMNAWAMDEWARQRMEEDDWTKEDVVHFLETREPIEFT